MNHLLRSHAPISDAGWGLLDGEARAHLSSALAARKLVDFARPRGWDHSATNLGRTTPLAETPCEAVSGSRPHGLPLIDRRADFDLPTASLRAAHRASGDVEL